MKHTQKNIIIATITALMLIITALGATASIEPSVTQVLPTPSSNDVNFIRMTADGQGLMINSVNAFYKYNGTTFNLIPSPALPHTTNLKISKSFSNIYISIANTTHLETWEYTPSTNSTGYYTFKDAETLGTNVEYVDFTCNPYGTYSDCSYLLRYTTNSTGFIIDANQGNLQLITPVTINSGARIFKPRLRTYLFNQIDLYRTTSLSSWENKGTFGSLPTAIWEEDDNYWAFAGSSSFCRNTQLTGTFYCISITNGSNDKKNFIVNDDDKSFFHYGILSTASDRFSGVFDNYFDNTSRADNESINPACDVPNINKYDYQVGLNYFNGLTSCGAGDARIFKITSTTGSSGSGTTPNALSYTILNSTYYDATITNIVGVQDITTTKSYAIATKDNKLAIISYDYNNPYNIVMENLTSSITATPRSINMLGDILVTGTSSNARFYNATESEEVTDLNLFATPQSSTFADDIVTTYTATAYDAYGCDTRLTDELIRYNTTSGTIISSTPLTCSDIAGTISGDVIYAHNGLNGIKIYYANLTLANTLDVVTSLGSNNPTDTLSQYTNNLAIVTGRNVIKVYDITNPTNPEFSWECRANQDITAIEMLTEDKIVIGGSGTDYSTIEICNKLDTARYSTQEAYYVAKILKNNAISAVPRDIQRLVDLNFVSAETTQFSIYEIQGEDKATTNIAPTIDEVTISSTTPCINETIYGQVTATDLNDINFVTIRYDCENDGTYVNTFNHNLQGNTINEQYSCIYSTSGIKTIRFIVNDTISNAVLTQSVNVGTCINNVNSFKINMLFREMTTGNAISGVSVDVEGLDEFVSGTDGRVAIGLTSSGIYNVTISKNGYLSQTGQIQTGVNYIIQLEPDTTTDDNGNQISRTILTINVKDTLGNPIPSATVSATEQITATSKTAQTDINGNAYLLDLLAGTPLRISVGKAPASDCVQTINGQGQISFDCSQSATSTPIYQSTFLTTTLANGEQKTINVILLKTNQLNYTTARGCEDYVEGIWLCSPLNITGTGDACHQDSDCITGRCEAGNSPDYRKCSQFNWTQCDALGRDRGNKCFTAVMGGRGIENLTNTMMDNFLYVLIGVFLFIALIMFINSVSGK